MLLTAEYPGTKYNTSSVPARRGRPSAVAGVEKRQGKISILTLKKSVLSNHVLVKEEPRAECGFNPFTSAHTPRQGYGSSVYCCTHSQTGLLLHTLPDRVTAHVL